MLAQRIATAVVGVIAAIFIVNYGQWVFAVAALALTALAWHEFYNMMVKREIEVAYYLGLTSVGLLWAIAWLGNPQETVAVLLLSTLVIFAKTVVAHASFNLRDAAYTVAGVLYIGLTFAHLVLLRFSDQSVFIATKFGALSAGALYLWLAFVGTWASDTFAFFVGSRFGRHKLAPAVSPGKTWEGVAGGLAGSVIGVTILGSLSYLPLVHSLVIGLLVGVVAPLGDLVESSIKRYAGVKDSGRLLPGHGGVLDRFDSIMFVAPAVYYYLYIFVVR
jgi:phosphatidate cytidylyltransferase